MVVLVAVIGSSGGSSGWDRLVQYLHGAVGFLAKALVGGHTERHFTDLTTEAAPVPELKRVRLL